MPGKDRRILPKGGLFLFGVCFSERRNAECNAKRKSTFVFPFFAQEISPVWSEFVASSCALPLAFFSENGMKAMRKRSRSERFRRRRGMLIFRFLSIWFFLFLSFCSAFGNGGKGGGHPVSLWQFFLSLKKRKGEKEAEFFLLLRGKAKEEKCRRWDRRKKTSLKAKTRRREERNKKGEISAIFPSCAFSGFRTKYSFPLFWMRCICCRLFFGPSPGRDLSVWRTGWPTMRNLHLIRSFVHF